MKLIVATAFLLVYLSSYSQPAKQVWQYLDEYCAATTDSTRAAYFRTVDRTGSAIMVRDYYMSGEPEMVAECSRIMPTMVQDGACTYYYKNGRIKEEGFYALNHRTGLFKAYYENGNPKSEIFYSKDARQVYHAYWNEDGEQLLDGGGNGHIAEKIKDSFHFKEVVDSVMTNHYAVKEGSTDTVFLFLDKEPEYEGGYEAMTKDLKRNLRYPKEARRNGIEGVVYVQFVIDKEGKITNIEVVRGIDPECDEIARLAVMKLKPWTPGTVHDRPVFVKYTLPLSFKLN